jgi:hypothetical protein
MTIEHKDITDNYIHEPKGVAAAAANKAYISDGLGSGSWQKIGVSQIDATSIKNTNLMLLSFLIPDLDVATSHYIVSPYAGTIAKIYSVIDQAIATADVTLTAKIATVPVTGGVVTIAYSGSAAGDVDSATPSAAKTVTAGQAIEFACGGQTTTTNSRARITVVIDVS